MDENEAGVIGNSDGGNGSFAGFDFIDPASIGAAFTPRTDSRDATKRRGRPPGSRNRDSDGGSPGDSSTAARGRPKKDTGTSPPIKGEDISTWIMVVHMAMSAKVPEMAMEQGEADQIGKSIANYLRYKKVQVDPEKLALAMMLGTIGMAEGSRALAIIMRLQSERAAKPRAAPNSSFVPVAPGYDGGYNMPFATH